MQKYIIQNQTTSASPDVTKTFTISTQDTFLTIFGFGIGSGTWSATIKFTAHFDGILDSNALTLTISNTSPTSSMTIQTGAKSFVGWVESISGTVSVNAIGSY